ncbi:MAG: hypothetical protein IJW00_00625 [Clostridia bacterium]|nr:hypothetical protein [Clostridia bacterium]
MTYADKGLALFSLMNDMSDSLINESDIGGVVSVKPKRERTGRFSAFMNHPAMVAVLCAVVSLGVLAAIVMAGRRGLDMPPVNSQPLADGTETDGQTMDDNLMLFLGMTYEEVVNALESDGMPYTYCLQHFFVSREDGSFFVLTMNPWGPFVVDQIMEYQEKQPTRQDIYAIRSGMSVHEILSLLGRPIGDLASGAITVAYKTVEGDEFWIYWTQIDGEFTVSRVLQIADESDVFWIGMTVDQVTETAKQKQMGILFRTEIDTPYILLKEKDGTVYVLECGTSTTDYVLFGSVKRVYQYTDKTPTDADISAIDSEDAPAFPEIIERLGVPLDYRRTAGLYSGVMGTYENYYFRYMTQEGGEYEIVFHHGHPQIPGGGGQGGSFSFVKIIVLD